MDVHPHKGSFIARMTWRAAIFVAVVYGSAWSIDSYLPGLSESEKVIEYRNLAVVKLNSTFLRVQAEAWK